MKGHIPPVAFCRDVKQFFLRLHSAFIAFCTLLRSYRLVQKKHGATTFLLHETIVAADFIERSDSSY